MFIDVLVERALVKAARRAVSQLLAYRIDLRLKVKIFGLSLLVHFPKQVFVLVVALMVAVHDVCALDSTLLNTFVDAAVNGHTLLVDLRLEARGCLGLDRMKVVCLLLAVESSFAVKAEVDKFSVYCQHLVVHE